MSIVVEKLSDYAERKALDHVLGIAAFPTPANIEAALWVGPGAGSEVSAAGYSRQVHNSWSAAAGRAASNSGAIVFGPARANWGQIDILAFFDSAADDLLCSVSFTYGGNGGEQTTIADGDVELSLNPGGLSTYAVHQFLDRMFKTAANSPPANTYVGLYSSNPGDADTGTELSGNGYARVLFNDWTAASTTTGGITSSDNNTAITFPTPTGSWSTATHWSIHDASTGGNLLAYGPLDADRTCGLNDTVSFAAGALAIYLE